MVTSSSLPDPKKDPAGGKELWSINSTNLTAVSMHRPQVNHGRGSGSAFLGCKRAR
jgi:hypothetical protein